MIFTKICKGLHNGEVPKDMLDGDVHFFKDSHLIIADNK